MRAFSLLAAVSLALSGPGAVSAQSIPSPYRFVETRQEAGAFAGWISPGTGRFGYGPKPGPLVGIRYALEFRGPLSIEATAATLPTTRDLVDPRRVEGDRVIGETDVVLMQFDGRVKLSLVGQRTWHGLSPYLLAGAGLAWDAARESLAEQDIPTDDRFSFGSSFAAQVGGGVRWFPSERVVVRSDALLHIWRLDAPNGFRDPDRGFANVGASEWANAGALTLGVGYRF